MKKNKITPSLFANKWRENGVLHSLDNSGRNIIYNDEIGIWARVDEIVWDMFGNKKRGDKEVFHIDGNIRNDSIKNLTLNKIQ